MQYPRYEFVVPRDHERCSTLHRPVPRPEQSRRTTRSRWRREWRRRIVGRRGSRPQLAIHEYLDLEFTIDDRP
jgi:hypothetical protein